MEKLLNLLFHKQPIYRDDNTLYLMRWYWNFGPLGTFKIHKFHQSDDDCLYDHPWNFISIILTTGYYEWTEWSPSVFEIPGTIRLKYGDREIIRHQYKPGDILFRKADHAHRIELINGKSAWTIVLTGNRKRKWGFWDKSFNFHYWREYVSSKHCE